MITWITVWVLTVKEPNRAYQFTYKTKEVCLSQAKNMRIKYPQCNWQQIPVVVK